MAIMYPSRLPDRVLADRMLKGEVKVYEALAALPDEFEIFYNRCPSAGSSFRAYQRRVDFIILHEKLGMLTIEVKGGGIRLGQDGGFEQYHPSSKGWSSINPYKQVEVATIDLIKTVKADGANYYIPATIAVIFADTLRRDITDTPQILPNGTLCADDLALVPTLIKTLFSASHRETVWARDAFLDMRRRLQNMPEARERDSKTSPASASRPWPSRKKTPATARQEKTPQNFPDNFPPATPPIPSPRPSALPAWLNRLIDWAVLAMGVVLIGFGVLWILRRYHIWP